MVLTEVGIVMEDREVQKRKVESLMIFTEVGMDTLEREEQ
jgi:hypothetical protein